MLALSHFSKFKNHPILGTDMLIDLEIENKRVDTGRSLKSNKILRDIDEILTSHES
jgi:hypothetical protein